MCRCPNIIFLGCFALRCFKQEASLSIFCKIPIAIFSIKLTWNEIILKTLATDVLSKPLRKARNDHCVKGVPIRSFSSPYRTEYLSIFTPNAGKYRPKKLRVGTLFTQWRASIYICFSRKDQISHGFLCRQKDKQQLTKFRTASLLISFSNKITSLSIYFSMLKRFCS